MSFYYKTVISFLVFGLFSSTVFAATSTTTCAYGNPMTVGLTGSTHYYLGTPGVVYNNGDLYSVEGSPTNGYNFSSSTCVTVSPDSSGGTASTVTLSSTTEAMLLQSFPHYRDWLFVMSVLVFLNSFVAIGLLYSVLRPSNYRK